MTLAIPHRPAHRSGAWPRRALFAPPIGRAPDPAPWTAPAADPPEAIGAAHPLADPATSLDLRRRGDAIEAAFAAIEPTLAELAPRQFETGFGDLASRALRERLGVEIAAAELKADWVRPLDMRALHARCVLATFRALVSRGFDRERLGVSDGERAEDLIRRWGFHAVDITPCADGRLSGLTDHILRVPPAIVTARRSRAGAMFEIDEAIGRWEAVELRRWREGRPTPPDAPTRFLKIGVYHFSLSDPTHGGCAAHGGDGRRAARALLERLEGFQTALRGVHGPGADAAVLMVGVNTDNDSLRVHVPDAAGRMDIDRCLDAGDLHAVTAGLSREAAKTAIREAVARCAGVGDHDGATEGMRWLCGYLLKNNLSQVDAVRAGHGGAYPEAGHAERLIVVGDPIDEAQLRNLAFQAQMRTVEEGAPDLFVGVAILRKRLEPRGLAVPVLAHVRHDPRLPGALEQAKRRALRMRAAILASHPALAAEGLLHVEAAVRAAGATTLTPVDPSEARS